MRRRALLAALGAGALGTTAGCSRLGADAGVPWQYEVGGDVDAVVDGTVLVRERAEDDPEGLVDLRPEPDGEVVGLDAGTGEVRWTYGGRSEQSSYSDLTVADAVYFVECTDDPCVEVHAVETDGSERWTRDISPGHWSPIVDDGTVFVSGGGRGVVYALDAATGSEEWTAELGAVPVVAVDDVVYVRRNGLLALDPDDGSRRWQYSLGEALSVLDAAVVDGTGYVVTHEHVDVVADGERVWRGSYATDRVGFDTEVLGVTADRVLVRAEPADERGARLYAFEASSGQRVWSTERLRISGEEARPAFDVDDGAAYVGTARLRVLDAADGSELWSVPVDGGVQSVTAVGAGESARDDEAGRDDGGDPGGDGVLVVHGDSRLSWFEPGGERTWTETVEGRVESHVLDGDTVYVGTRAGVFALDRERSR